MVDCGAKLVALCLSGSRFPAGRDSRVLHVLDLQAQAGPGSLSEVICIRDIPVYCHRRKIRQQCFLEYFMFIEGTVRWTARNNLIRRDGRRFIWT